VGAAFSRDLRCEFYDFYGFSDLPFTPHNIDSITTTTAFI
jgi:hypothetical protein